MKLQAIALAVLLPVAAAHAQEEIVEDSLTNNEYMNTAAAVVQSFRSALSSACPGADAVTADKKSTISPYLYQITSPGIYYSAALAPSLSLGSGSSLADGGGSGWQSATYREAMLDGVSALLTRTYLENPQLISYSEQQVSAERVVEPTVVRQAKAEDLQTIIEGAKEIKDVSDVVGDVTVDLKVEKPNFWTTAGRFSLQFTQNYFSEKWYKGGNNNVTMLSNLVLEANYNDQRKIQWDNKLDMRLGFMTTTSDSCHQFLPNNDRIALNSKLGVKAAKFWNYALSVEATTQFMPGYRSNDRRKYSDFIAPLDVFVSLGMDYKPQIKKGSMSVALLPLSYKMRYIHSDDENIHRAYNLPHGDFKQDFGSKMELNTNVRILPDLTWRCRFYYFTSYKYAESELENVLSFQFNKYISSEVNTLWRFDDNRAPSFRDDNLGYFQFKEYFTLGLSYKF